MRVKLTVAYDGTNYHGYQSQVNGASVQDVLEEAIEGLFGQKIRTMGASRTDLNSRLPQDVRIMDSCQVADTFHPRFQTTVKTYRYHILNRRFPDPLTRNTEMHYYYPLDEEKMNEAAAFLVGEHDFASFAASGFSAKTTVRTIYRAEVVRTGDRVVFTVTGNGFLYNMVRIIAGTLLEIGGGKYPPQKMKDILEAKDRAAAGPTAIAKGLVLERIEYPEAES